MRRIVTKNDEHGASYIVSENITNVEVPLSDIDNRFEFFNLWTTDIMPVNFDNDDPVINKNISTSPVENGSLFRIVNYPPEKILLDKINSMTHYELVAFENKVGIKLSFNGKHPLMHTTKSIDYAVVLTGEIFLVLDKQEILLKPTDTVIQRGTSHAWSNRSNSNCLMAYVLLDANY